MSLYGPINAHAPAIRPYASQSLGDPGPFRLQHRQAIVQIITVVIREKMSKAQAVGQIQAYAQAHIAMADRERCVEIAETQLLSLHEGSIARYHVRPSEFQARQLVWNRSS